VNLSTNPCGALVRATLLASSIVSLAACSSLTSAGFASGSYAELMSSADGAFKANQSAAGLLLLERAAKSEPAKKEPWLRMAQVQFEERRYGSAINAAEEVLQRDNADVTAKSILAASGLRVSANALEQLRAVGELGGARDEAKALARTMRDALGESILPSVSASEARARASRPAPRHPAATEVRPAQVPSTGPAADTSPSRDAPIPAKPEAAEPKRNPFSALKG